MNLICMEIGKEYILASINMRVSEACYRQADNNVSVVDISAHLSPRIINTEPSLIVSTNEIQTKHCLVQHTILTYIDRSSVIESFLRERTYIYIFAWLKWVVHHLPTCLDITLISSGQTVLATIYITASETHFYILCYYIRHNVPESWNSFSF